MQQGITQQGVWFQIECEMSKIQSKNLSNVKISHMDK